ncbi:MAG: S-methyl-5-thioribose kinase [Alphaproteobacteria bacterium]
MATPQEYLAHDEASLPAYIATIPRIAALLGPPASWQISEVGDGNLNLVFIAKGSQGSVIVKQALPYVRLVGESWPLPLSRAHFEHMALVEQARHTPGLVPAIIHYDETLALIVMEYLTPHIIMRRGMIDGTVYPKFAGHITTFMARNLFFTSDLAIAAGEKKTMIGAFCGNHALCKITEDLIFTDPYRIAETNRWTTPQLDAIATEFREDLALKVAVSRLKIAFLCHAEALLHGDLHTGSIMVTPDETKVIDPEFAFFGPMGFDIGAVIANLLISYFSQDGHETQTSPRDDYRQWVLSIIESVWDGFRAKFLDLWRTQSLGDGYPAALFSRDNELEAERQAYMDRLFADTVGFAAAKMIRRILGLAHNIDLELIEDPNQRAACEIPTLRLARDLMVNTANYRDIAAITQAARRFREARQA